MYKEKFITKAELTNENVRSIFKNQTKHLKERGIRIDNVNMNADISKVFFVDAGHENGPEFHYILEDATDVVVNVITRKVITVLFCRPGQLKKLFSSIKETIPSHLLEASYDNVYAKRNEM